MNNTVDDLLDMFAGCLLIAGLCVVCLALRYLMFDAPPGDYVPIPSAYAEP